MKTLLLALILTCSAPIAGYSAGSLIQLTDANSQQILKNNSFVVVDVYTDWCGPCKNLAPIFQKLSEDMGDRYTFTKLNGDEESNLAHSFKITAYPTIIFIKNGQEVGRVQGFYPYAQLVTMLNQYFK